MRSSFANARGQWKLIVGGRRENVYLTGRTNAKTVGDNEKDENRLGLDTIELSDEQTT